MITHDEQKSLELGNALLAELKESVFKYIDLAMEGAVDKPTILAAVSAFYLRTIVLLSDDLDINKLRRKLTATAAEVMSRVYKKRAPFKFEA